MVNISSDVIRGYNDTIILYLLLDRPSYGYEISKQIRLISEEKYVIKEKTVISHHSLRATMQAAKGGPTIRLPIPAENITG